MEKYVKPPWKFELYRTGGNRKFVLTAEGAVFGDFRPARDRDDPDEKTIATIRLMQAAPELLNACLAVVRAAEISSSEERFGENVTAIMEEVNDAIRAATRAKKGQFGTK